MRTLLLAVLGIGVMLAGALGAQAPAAALSTLDYFEIDNLIARYGHGFDSGAEQGYMWADVFTPDGVFMDGSGREYRGRDAIARFGSGGPNSRKTPTNMNHFITNVLVEPAGGGATARSTVFIGGRIGGTYFDSLAKTNAGWRIRERVLVRPGTTPEAVKAMTMRTDPVPEAMQHADASGAVAGAMKLTAADYAHILQASLNDPSVVTNVVITAVANGVVVKAYRMRVDPANPMAPIGAEGVRWSFFAKRGNNWQAMDAHDLAAGSPIPDALRQYVTMPPMFVLPASPAPPAAAAADAVSAEDYAAIRQLYARTAFAEDTDGPHHFVYNIRVQKTATGARGDAHVVVAGAAPTGRGTVVSQFGDYRDELTKTAAGWQIANRTFVSR
jgi:hypothetical protein